MSTMLLRIVIIKNHKEVEGGNTLVESVIWENQLEGQGLLILNDIHLNYIPSMFDQVSRKKLPGWVGGILKQMEVRWCISTSKLLNVNPNTTSWFHYDIEHTSQ